MNSYQLTLVVNNKLEDKARKDLLDSVTKQFGKLEKEDLWGVRSLAYPIKHNEKGYYAHYDFQADPTIIPNLDKNIKLNEDIIRYLLIKK